MSVEAPTKIPDIELDKDIKEPEGDRVVSKSDLEKSEQVWPEHEQERYLLSRSPQEVLGSLETPQDCIEFISSSLLPEHRALVDKEIKGMYMGDYRAAGFTIGADPEYQRFYHEYFIPTLDRLGSFELEPDEQERVMQAMVTMYSGFTSYDTYSEDTFLLFSKHMLQNGGAQAFPHINAMYDRYFEGVSSHLIQGENTAKSYLASARVDGINSRAGALPGRLALLLAGETKDSSLPPEETIEFSIGFADRYPYGSLRTFSDAMESMGVENSVPILLSHLSDENEQVRRFAAETLFRLELGERDVSDGELEVFGKVFKLTSLKGQQHIIESLQAARRLDSHGRWAVFDESGGAKGIFTVEAADLSPQGDETVEKSIDLELGNLFREACIRRVDETPEDRALREEVFGEYLAHFSQVIDGMHERTGVWLNSLELHEQAFFVHVYRQAVAEGRDSEVESIIRNYGEEALKVFVTMEYGESGDAILDFLGSSEVQEHTKRTVLSGYYELSHRADAWRNVFANAEIVTGHRFASEVYEAFIRKSSEYFRAAMMIERGEGGDVRMQELIESLSTIVYSLNVLESLYKENSGLQLEGKPQVQAECADPECTMLIEDARTTWILSDQYTGDRIVLSVRPQATVMVGNRPGGEARINFKVSNKNKGLEARIGLDLSDYGEFIGEVDKPAVVSLDLGTGVPDRAEGIYPSHRVGRVLSLVEGSEGGHNEASFSAESAKYFEDISHSLTGYLENRFTSEGR